MPKFIPSVPLLPRLTMALTRTAPQATNEPSRTQTVDDPVRAAAAHKQRVRAAATRKVARLALLFLTCDEGPAARHTETELVTAAWSAAKASLGHQHFVHTQPATFADLRALAA